MYLSVTPEHPLFWQMARLSNTSFIITTALLTFPWMHNTQIYPKTIEYIYIPGTILCICICLIPKLNRQYIVSSLSGFWLNFDSAVASALCCYEFKLTSICTFALCMRVCVVGVGGCSLFNCVHISACVLLLCHVQYACWCLRAMTIYCAYILWHTHKHVFCLCFTHLDTVWQSFSLTHTHTAWVIFLVWHNAMISSIEWKWKLLEQYAFRACCLAFSAPYLSFWIPESKAGSFSSCTLCSGSNVWQPLV